jgi:hypothetical protein
MELAPSTAAGARWTPISPGEVGVTRADITRLRSLYLEKKHG